MVWLELNCHCCINHKQIQRCLFLEECEPTISRNYKEENTYGTTRQTYKMQCLFTMCKENVYTVESLSKAYDVTIQKHRKSHQNLNPI